MSNALFQSTMTALAQNLGLDGLTFSEEGDSCLLGFDDFEVSINYFAEPDLALVYTVVGTLPEDSSSKNALYAALLEGNVMFHKTQGFTLAAGETTGVTLQGCLPMQHLDKDRMSAWIQNLLNVAEHWQSVCLEHYLPEGESGAAEEPASYPEMGMMRV